MNNGTENRFVVSGRMTCFRVPERDRKTGGVKLGLGDPTYGLSGNRYDGRTLREGK